MSIRAQMVRDGDVDDDSNIFSYMSDARAPAIDVQIAAQGGGITPSSFNLILRSLLIGCDV